MSQLGTYLRVYVGDDFYDVEPDRVHAVDAAVTLWMDTGRDSLVPLPLLTGDEAVEKASRITNWLTSSPEGRRRSVEIQKAGEDEEREHRVQAGYKVPDPWDEAA